MIDEKRELRDLFMRGRAGESAAQRGFLTKVTPLLRSYFRRRLPDAPDDVEDLVQDTLIALHTRRDTFDTRYPLSAWFYSIAKYRLCDFIRRRRRRRESPLEGLDFGAVDANFAASDAQRDVAKLMQHLSDKQRAAVRLVKLEQQSVRDAATQTELSESAVKVAAHRGFRAMQRLVAQYAA